MMRQGDVLTIEGRWQDYISHFPARDTVQDKRIFLAGAAAAMRVHGCGWFPRTKAGIVLAEIFVLNDRT